MASSYTASDIEVLSGLDPVRRRPGMYTDTTRPNHLAHEVIDNSVDEALAGHCENIRVTVFKDGSLQVEDDGRGMPVDIHPKEKISGVELILTRLHAGGKFNDKTYQHAADCTASVSRWSTRSPNTSNAGCAAAARNTT
jgi:topoisomerase-4 subunit B